MKILDADSSEIKKRRRTKTTSKTSISDADAVQEVKKSNNSDYIASLELPSGFKPYKFKELLIRPLNIDEVKKLQPMLRGIVNSISLADVLEKVSSVRLDKLTYGDFWFVMAWLRINTFKNAPYLIQWDCPSCGKSNERALDLSELDVVELPENYKEPAYLTLSNGEEVPLRLHRVEDEVKIKEYVQNMKNTKTVSEEDSFIPELAISIDNGKTLFNNVEFLEGADITPDDLVMIEDFQKTFAHGLPKYITGNCAEEVGGCGYKSNRLHLRFRIHETIPSSEYGRFIRNNVRFG